jgi:hypothetical protein
LGHKTRRSGTLHDDAQQSKRHLVHRQSLESFSDALQLPHPPPRMLLMAIGSALGIKFQKPAIEKPKYITSVQEARQLMAITGGRMEGIAKIIGHG